MRTALTASLAVLAIAGCSDPYASEPPTHTPGATATTAPAPEAGDAVPASARPERSPSPSAGSAGGSPVAVARAYAALLINWEGNALVRQLELAKALAADPLRAELTSAAASAAADESLRRDRAGSRGHVVAVVVHGSGRTRRLVVVTREEQLRAGRGTLEGPHATVYTGRARRTGVGWRIVAWEHEP